ncbi:MAG TPA: 3' terminal RNA ribose 2'-O-methyltransferase Hen1 [Streptosporangiaceae bacterium]
MLLTITTTCRPATDLGYLLHKHPDRLQSFAISAGMAHVFYPEATAQTCTAALLLEVDPIALVKGNRGNNGGRHGQLTQYVNDRPYAASSMLAVALKEAFRTALTGRCDARPELAATPIPLEIRVPALRCQGGVDLARRVFEPLGWAVTANTVPLDPVEWGDSPYLDVTLTGAMTLKNALSHLYVLLPALDDAKHYWVATDEVDKLIRAGGDWLAGHPEKALITQRYLAHRRELTDSALARLAETDDTDPEELDNAVGHPDPDPDSDSDSDSHRRPEADEAQKPLAVQRRAAVLAVLREINARTVGDFGCGAGALTADLLADQDFRDLRQIVATDVSARALQLAARRLRLDRMPDRQRERLKLFQSALTYRDDRLAGLDAAVLMEVIEHVDPDRMPSLELAVFGFAAPGAVVVTTPNAEYNVRYDTLPPGHFRHRDHRFEWTRAEFTQWATRISADYGYAAAFRAVGDVDDEAGPPTQLAVFTKEAREGKHSGHS